MEQPSSGANPARRSEKLPRASILRKRPVLRRIREQGKRRSNRWLAVTVEPCVADQSARAAFLTPKRLGSAVVRNRIRRRMREIYRRYLAAEAAGWNWVWSARNDAVHAAFPELKEAMRQLLTAQKSNRRSR